MPTRLLPRNIPGPTPPTPPPPPPVERPATITLPEGAVSTRRPNSTKPYGVPWDRVRAVVPAVEAAVARFPVDPYVMLAMCIVESDCQQEKHGQTVIRPDDGWGGGPAVGILQVKPALWQRLVPEADPYALAGNVLLGTAIMAEAIRQHGSWQKALTRVYFPETDPNGTTPEDYVATVEALLAEMRGITPAPRPRPAPEPAAVDLVTVIVGGRPTDTSYGYRAPAAESCRDCYGYFGQHCGRADQHPGIDATTVRGQTLYSPIPGTVVCAGTDRGPGAWQTGCAAFRDDMGNGAGRIEILHDDGQRSLILGHCSDALVDVGDRVEPGDPVARAGGMHGWHVHIEGRRHVGGARVYCIEGARALFGSVADPGTLPPELPAFTFLGTPNQMSRQGREPRAIVCHVTDDMSFANVRGWFQNPASGASSHWVIDRDGRASQFVGSALAAFTNGKVERPRRDIPWLAERADAFIAKRENANWYTITLEFVGKPDVAFTAAQLETGIAIARYYLHVYPGIPRSRGGIMRHADFDSVDRPYCPGPLWPHRDFILACGGDPERMT